MITIKNPRMRIAAALGGGVLAAVLAFPGLPAVAKSSPPKSSAGSIKLAKKAVLGLNGGAVQVSAEVTCRRSVYQPYLSVELSQGAGRTFGHGWGSRRLVCDGRPHPLKVPVASDSAAFRTGTASARSSTYICSRPDSCVEVTASRQVSIARS